MKELPKGWEWATIGDVVDVLDSRRVPVNATERATRPGNVPYYGATGQVGWINVALFDEPLVLLGEDGAPFLDPTKPKAYLIKGPSWVNNHAHVLRPRAGLTTDRFLKHVLDQVDYRPHVNGTTRLKLTQKAMSAMPVPLAPRAEQDRIVAAIEEHLSRLNAAEAEVRSAERRIATLSEVSSRQALESQPWPWTTLGEIAEIKGGVTKDGKRQGDPSFVEVPYLRVANVQRGHLDLSEVSTIRVLPDKAESLRLEPGDVLLNEGGDRDKLGRGWVWEGQIDRCIHQNHVFRARLTDDFDPYFVSAHANTWGQGWFEEHGRQTTNLASINLGTLKQLPVPAPSRVEQEAIVGELKRSTEAQARLQASIENARKRAAALRRSILAAAFSGQLVPQDPDDEPASELLERIRAERASAPPRKRTRKAAAS